jgi:hypothetical protein
VYNKKTCRVVPSASTDGNDPEVITAKLRTAIPSSETQVHSQLQEAVAANRLSNDAEVLSIETSRCQYFAYSGITRTWAIAGIKGEVIERRIKAWVVENVERVGLEL